jgi:hypothetical protein
MTDWWSKDPLVQAAGKVATVVANPEQWWANDPVVDQPSMVSSAVRGVGQGISLGASDEGGALVAASPLWGSGDRAKYEIIPNPIDMIAGGGRMLLEKIAPGTFGDGGGKAYDAALEQRRADDKKAQKANPISFGAGEIAGGIAPVLVGASAAPMAFGLRGGLKMRSGMSAGSGGIVGGVQGFSSGEGGAESRSWEALKGIAGGTAIGGVAPALGQLAGAGYRKVADALIERTASVPGYSNNAVRIVADALESQRAVNPQMQADMARFGPEAMLLDSGDAVKGLAQGIATRPGEARARIVEALTERQAARNGRIGTDLDEALGRAVVPSQVETQLAAGRQAVGDAYERVFENARAVDTTALANQLDTMLVDLRGDPRRAVQNVRNMLNIPGQQVLDPSPRAVFNIRHAIDGLQAKEADSAVLSQLGFARQAIDDYLREAVPGLKQVDARFQELARQSEGLKRGSSILDSGKEALRPAEMVDTVTAGVTPDGMFVGPSGEAFRMRQGTRAEIDRLVGTMSNDYLAVRKAVKGEGDWNRDKLAQLFGEERASKIVNSLDREAAFQLAYDDVVRNSMTAQRLAGKEMVAVRDGSESSGAGNTALVGVVGGPTGLAAQGAIKGARAAKTVLDTAADEARNSDISKLLTTRGPAVDRIFEVLSRNARGRQSAEAGSAATERVVQALLQSRGYDLGALSAPYAQRVARSALR